MATRKKQNRFTKNTIAVVYDFDGTLSPRPMQEYTVLPMLSVNAETFWRNVNSEAKETSSEAMLVYMRHLLEKARNRGVSIRKKDFKSMAKSIEYFPGVETWFNRINNYVSKTSNKKVKVKHYIVSAGMKEILDGISIKNHFEKIFCLRVLL